MPSLPFCKNLRRGQALVVEMFAKKRTVVAKLPTGYGKTKTAVASYAFLRGKGVVNRLLYVVPRTAQCNQAADEVPAELAAMTGALSKSHVVSSKSNGVAIAAHRRGDCEVFVTTIQALSMSEALREDVRRMMQTGLWMMVIDEHHHYGVEGDWTRQVQGLPFEAMLAMSATPDRKGEKSPFGKPDVTVRYCRGDVDGAVVDGALEEGAVKELHLHAYEYRIDAITVNGDVIQFTTEELFDQSGGDSPVDIEKFMASRRARWSPKYISPLILNPVERMVAMRTAGIRTQMIVQALSCSHAEMVCEQVRALVPESMRVDWVGTGPRGRTDADNDRILRQFCPPKDKSTGRRNWTLDILVNVGIAGEGLDCTDVCEVVFLTSPSINNSTLQTIGRGARKMRQAESDSVICVINVDSGCELAPFVGKKVMHLFDGVTNPDDIDDDTVGGDGSDERDYKEAPDELRVEVVDVSLVDIKTDPLYAPAILAAAQKVQETKPEYTDDQVQQIAARAAESAVLEHIRKRDESFNQTAIIAQAKERVDAFVSKLSGLAIKSLVASGFRPEKSLVGDLRRRINGKKKALFGAVDSSADIDRLNEQYKWLKALEREMLTEGVPTWLR